MLVYVCVCPIKVVWRSRASSPDKSSQITYIVLAIPIQILRPLCIQAWIQQKTDCWWCQKIQFLEKIPATGNNSAYVKIVLGLCTCSGECLRDEEVGDIPQSDWVVMPLQFLQEITKCDSMIQDLPLPRTLHLGLLASEGIRSSRDYSHGLQESGKGA